MVIGQWRFRQSRITTHQSAIIHESQITNRLFRGRNEVAPAIASVTRVCVLLAERLLFTLAYDNQPIGSDTGPDQIVANRGGTALTEREVVLVGAARVGVT